MSKEPVLKNRVEGDNTIFPVYLFAFESPTGNIGNGNLKDFKATFDEFYSEFNGKGEVIIVDVYLPYNA